MRSVACSAVLPSPHEPFETNRQNVRTGQYAGNAIIRGTPIERAILSQTVSVIPNTIYDIGFWLGIDASSGFGMDINDSRTQIFADGLGLLPSSFLSINNGSGPEDFVEIGGGFDSGARTSIAVSFAINGSGIAEAGASFDDFYVSVQVPPRREFPSGHFDSFEFRSPFWVYIVNLTLFTRCMGRSPLSAEEVDRQRALVVQAAEGLFAERGYEGVTLRAIAKALGRSHTAPYRYFEGKAEVFVAARLAAYSRFAEVQERVCREAEERVDRLTRLGSSYVQFALDEPDAYRLMFELKQPAATHSRELREAETRAWLPIHDTVQAVVEAGLLHGDANELAHLMWAGLHGVVSLHLAGKLTHGLGLEELHERMKRVLFLGGNAPIDA